VGLRIWRKFLRSSIEIPYPVRCRIEYRSIEAWPALSTNRSRSNQSGSAGLCFIVFAKSW
jgi:hypothetical protein